MRRHHGAVKHLALRADGKRLASGGADRSIQFWDLTSGEPIFDNQGPLTQVNAICVSSADEVAALHTGGQLSLWSLSTGRHRHAPKHPAPVLSIACSPRGRWALGMSNGEILLTGPGSDGELRWPAHQGETRLLAYSGDGEQLASCASDGMVKIWDASNGEPVLFLPDATQKCSVECLACHPTQPIVAACGIQWMSAKESDGCISLWNWKTRQLVLTIEGGASRIAFSADGALLAAVSLYETVMIFDAKTGSLIRELSGRDYATNAIAFDRKSGLFASGSDDCGLRIWDAKSFSMLAAFDLETRIKDIAFTPDGAGVVTGNGSSTCFLVDLEGLSSPH
jgi:WD40 repeat protein